MHSIFMWSQVTKYFAPSIRKICKCSRPQLGYSLASELCLRFHKSHKSKEVCFLKQKKHLIGVFFVLRFVTLPGPRVRLSNLTGSVYLFYFFKLLNFKKTEKLFDSRTQSKQFDCLGSQKKKPRKRLFLL